MKLDDKNKVALLTLALIASSLVALTTTSHASTPAANIIICTDLTTHLPEILRANKKSCDFEDAATIFHPEVIDSPTHSGTGFITLRICTSINPLFSYQLIRTSCAKYQKSTDYYRAISTPKTPTISSTLAFTHDGAILSIAQDGDGTDSPITYYLIKNLTTGITTKVARAPLANLTQIHIWNLSAQTQYTFTITAVSADGISASSSVSGAITTPHAPAAPVAAPAFTLSASFESRASNSAATGFTINSTGGVIASFAISPAAPAGISFNTSTGAFSGTPTAVASATVYTVTATNASGSANATFTFTVTSAGYNVGDTGPGGGLIYYYRASGFNCGNTFTPTGSPTGGLCHYLEVAPNTWSGGSTDPRKTWAYTTDPTCLVPGITADASANNSSDAIGLGRKNSLAIENQMCNDFGNDGTAYAAYSADDYRGGRLSDWYLPTSAELNQLCKWALGLAWASDATPCSSGTLSNGGLLIERYWSSSEGDASRAWYQDFNDGEQVASLKSTEHYVRPIRAF
ncbi:MAG: putative Ig domain-containing protein [Actinomycetes bacterium]